MKFLSKFVALQNQKHLATKLEGVKRLLQVNGIINGTNVPNTLNNMKKNSFVWSCLVMTFFVACQQTEVENLQAEDMPMSISASINGQSENPKSRYAGTDPSHVEFQTGDAIGLFIDSKPTIEWTLSSSGWTTDEIVYWPDKSKSHTFRAFYPFAETSSYASVPMPSLLNQTGSIESISNCDFLVATKIQSYNEGEMVEFKGEESAFKHVSTLLKLTFLEGEELSGAILKKITIEGSNIVSPATYSFINGTVTLSPDAASDVLLADGLSQDLSDGATYYFIVNEKQDASSSVKLAVEYEVNGKVYVAQKNGLAGNVFDGGMCQSYIVTIQNSVLVVSGATISPWGIGESMDDIIINGEETSESV